MTCIRAGVMLLLASTIPARAAELELRYAAIERVIADQLFSQDGRLYVRGSKSTRCKFAYLESPHVGAVNGRLRVSGRFSGRTALDMMGARFEREKTALLEGASPRQRSIASRSALERRSHGSPRRKTAKKTAATRTPANRKGARTATRRPAKGARRRTSGTRTG